MSYKIGHKHLHARDQSGYSGCHQGDCRCARCLLETGGEIPKDRRGEVERYRDSVSEAYRCERCGGLKISYLDAWEKGSLQMPAMLWCMSCGKEVIAPPNYRKMSDRMADAPTRTLSLRERMAGATIQVPGRTTQKQKIDPPRREWTTEERRDLQALIKKHGVQAGSRAYLAKYPERGRTEQGCAYQWNTKISKGEGI